MFESSLGQRWFARVGRAAFFALVPLLFLPLVLRGRTSLVVVQESPFALGNYRPSSLTPFLAEAIGYGYYTATLLAVSVAIGAALFLRWRRRSPAGTAPLVWYLPAFVAGVEAVRHAFLLGSRHGFSSPTFAELRSTWYIACAASLSVVFLCVAIGFVLTAVVGQRPRLPWAALALGVSVVGGWCAQLSVIWLAG